jgi:hypothetical protein
MFRCKEFVVDLFTRFKDLQTDNFTSSLIDMFLWMVDDQEYKGGKIALWAGVLETFIRMLLTYTNTKYIRQKSNDSRAKVLPSRSSSTSKQKGSSSSSKQKEGSSTSKQKGSSSTSKQFSEVQMVLLENYLPPFSEDRLCKDNVTVQEYIMVYQDFRVSFVIVLKGLLNILFAHVLTGNI